MFATTTTIISSRDSILRRQLFIVICRRRSNAPPQHPPPTIYYYSPLTAVCRGLLLCVCGQRYQWHSTYIPRRLVRHSLNQPATAENLRHMSFCVVFRFPFKASFRSLAQPIRIPCMMRLTFKVSINNKQHRRLD